MHNIQKELVELKQKIEVLEASISCPKPKPSYRLQDRDGLVDITVEDRDGYWWALKGSRIRAKFAKSCTNRCRTAIEKRLEMHQRGLGVLSEDLASFVLQEDFSVVLVTEDETMNLSPVATFANASPSNGRGFKECLSSR